MYAVIKTGGKQYRVAADDVLEVERLAGEVGSMISFREVLMIGGNGEPMIGSPLLDGASVTAEVVDQKRGRKIIVFKKKRRKNYRRKNGHRQYLTRIRILEVLASGEKATKKPSSGASAARNNAAKGDNSGGDASRDRQNDRETAGNKTASAFEQLSEPRGAPDDISLLSGVGPALEKKLADYGIFHFWQVANMKPDDIKKMDEELKLGGRVEREEWVDQARELMEGKPPRAKVDQKAAASKEKADKADKTEK